MTESKVIEKINSPVELVWSKIGDFAGLKPGEGVESVEYSGEGVGMLLSLIHI